MDEQLHPRRSKQPPSPHRQNLDSCHHPNRRMLARRSRSSRAFFTTTTRSISSARSWSFSGLWQSFTQEAAQVEAGIIALGLAAYTLLLALTAWLIIRLGHVWEDARSILLVIVLMFLTISVSLDPVLNAKEHDGALFVVAGFLFAVLVSEGLFATYRSGCRRYFGDPITSSLRFFSYTRWR